MDEGSGDCYLFFANRRIFHKLYLAVSFYNKTFAEENGGFIYDRRKKIREKGEKGVSVLIKKCVFPPFSYHPP